MTLNLPFIYVLWLEEYCQISPNKNRSPNLWHVTSLLYFCLELNEEILLKYSWMKYIFDRGMLLNKLNSILGLRWCFYQRKLSSKDGFRLDNLLTCMELFLLGFWLCQKNEKCPALVVWFRDFILKSKLQFWQL